MMNMGELLPCHGWMLQFCSVSEEAPQVGEMLKKIDDLLIKLNGHVSSVQRKIIYFKWMILRSLQVRHLTPD